MNTLLGLIFSHLKENHFVIFFILPWTDLDSSFLRINGAQSPELFSIHISRFSTLGFLTNTKVTWFIWKGKNDLTYGIHNYMLRNKKSLEKNKIYNRSQWSVTVKNDCRDFWPTQVKALIQEEVATLLLLNMPKGFPDGSALKNLPANAGDSGSIPRSGRSPGAGNGNPL